MIATFRSDAPVSKINAIPRISLPIETNRKTLAAIGKFLFLQFVYQSLFLLIFCLNVYFFLFNFIAIGKWGWEEGRFYL